MIGPSQRPLPAITQHLEEQTSIPPKEFKPPMAARERPQAHALVHAANGIILSGIYWTQNTVENSVL